MDEWSVLFGVSVITCGWPLSNSCAVFVTCALGLSSFHNTNCVELLTSRSGTVALVTAEAI